MKLLISEWYRVVHEKVLWVIIIILCLFGAFFASKDLFLDIPPVPSTPLDAQGIFMYEASDLGFIFMLFGGLAASLIVGKLFSERTVNSEIASGQSRKAVFTARCITCLVIPTVVTFLALTAGIIRSSIFFGSPSAETFFYLFRTFCLFAPAFLSLCVPIVLFIVVFRDVARSCAATVIFMFFVLWTYSILMHFVPTIPDTSFTSDPSIPLLIHPVFLVRLALLPSLEVGQAVQIVGISLGWILFFVAIAWAIFRRLELK